MFLTQSEYSIFLENDIHLFLFVLINVAGSHQHSGTAVGDGNVLWGTGPQTWLGMRIPECIKFKVKTHTQMAF